MFDRAVTDVVTLTVVDDGASVTEPRPALQIEDDGSAEFRGEPVDVSEPDDEGGADGDGTDPGTDREDDADGTPASGVLATRASIGGAGRFSGTA